MPEGDPVGKAKDLIKGFERLKLDAYLPTPNDVPTIGYGSTQGVKLWDTIDEATAEKLLLRDMAESAKWVRKLVKVPLNDNQFAAMVSLMFNVGPTWVGKSKALKALNQGDFETASHEFFDEDRGFTKQAGKKLGGLVRRRQVERELFEEDPEPKKKDIGSNLTQRHRLF